MIPAFIYHSQSMSRAPELKIFQWQYLRLDEWRVDFPIRPFWRLYWNETPGARIVCGDREVELAPDHVVLIPPFTSYQAMLERPLNHFYVHFRPEANFPRLAPQVAIQPTPPLLRHIIDGEHSPKHLELCMFALLLGILANMPEAADGESGGAIDFRIRKILEMVDTLPRNACGNGSLAHAANMATSSFQHLFQKQIGVPPQQYVMRILMERAGLLLSSTDLPIPEIAERLGFANRYHFTVVFTRWHEMTSPAAYRRKSRAPK